MNAHTRFMRVDGARPQMSRVGLALLAPTVALIGLTSCTTEPPALPVSEPCVDCSTTPYGGHAPTGSASDDVRKGEDDPAGLLGRSLKDPVTVAYLTGNGCAPANMHWACPLASTEFSINGNLRIDAVIFDAPGAETAGYTGPLPNGVTFRDDPDTLVEKLGQPVAGRVGPNGFLKWQNSDGDVALFVNFLPRVPLRMSSVQLAIQN
jgi:hypothetical protein